MSNFIPRKKARRHFVAEHLNDAGITKKAAANIAWLLPDILIFHAVYVDPKTCFAEILDNGACFLNYDGKSFYCGTYDWNSDCPFRASNGWTAIEIAGLDDDSARSVDIDQLLEAYEESRWPIEHKHHRECESKFTIDITPILKEFLEVSDEPIH